LAHATTVSGVETGGTMMPQSEAIADRPGASRLDLYWIPLGAGASVVRVCGKTYEALAAAAQRRRRRDLFHSALVASTGDVRFFIEMAPIPDDFGPQQRGVVGEGPVGTRWARRFRVFRYEIRRWREGEIPDIRYAVASPVRIADDAGVVERVLDLLPLLPTPVWGRDELHAGEMWNSNSVISWVLTQAGVLAEAGRPPGNGRAPGWDAGVLVAERDAAVSLTSAHNAPAEGA
jgi:hypothetical protein